MLLGALLPDQAARVAFIVATGACWGESCRGERADVAQDLMTVFIRVTKRSRRLRTVPIVGETAGRWSPTPSSTRRARAATCSSRGATSGGTSTPPPPPSSSHRSWGTPTRGWSRGASRPPRPDWLGSVTAASWAPDRNARPESGFRCRVAVPRRAPLPRPSAWILPEGPFTYWRPRRPTSRSSGESRRGLRLLDARPGRGQQRASPVASQPGHTLRATRGHERGRAALGLASRPWPLQLTSACRGKLGQAKLQRRLLASPGDTITVQVRPYTSWGVASSSWRAP